MAELQRSNLDPGLLGNVHTKVDIRNWKTHKSGHCVPFQTCAIVPKHGLLKWPHTHTNMHYVNRCVDIYKGVFTSILLDIF